MNIQDQPSDWCILRTSSAKTLGLAATLTKDGFEAWTPAETRTFRVPSSNVKREVILPIMPSYVFARVAHLVDLLQLAAMPVKPRRGAGLRDPAHASFSVMRFSGGIPTISDRQLNGLRRLEAKRTPRKKADRSFPPGVSVRVHGGAYGGMRGRVERSSTKATLVSFAGSRFTVTIATSILHEDGVTGDQLPVALAAE